MIIAISGTPGTGKTQVAKALSKKLDCRLIELNVLAKERSIYCGYDDERKCDIVDIGKMEKEIKNISTKKECIIIESHYAHDMPSDVLIVLRTNPKELKDRMQKRDWNEHKIEENIEAEIMEICKCEAIEMRKEVIEVDTTKKEPDDVAEEIASLLDKKNGAGR